MLTSMIAGAKLWPPPQYNLTMDTGAQWPAIEKAEGGSVTYSYLAAWAGALGCRIYMTLAGGAGVDTAYGKIASFVSSSFHYRLKVLFHLTMTEGDNFTFVRMGNTKTADLKCNRSAGGVYTLQLNQYDLTAIVNPLVMDVWYDIEVWYKSETAADAGDGICLCDVNGVRVLTKRDGGETTATAYCYVGNVTGGDSGTSGYIHIAHFQLSNIHW